MNLPEKGITPSEFAKKIKEKYPQYENVEDTDLVNKMIEKYPEYKSQITFQTPDKPKEVKTEVENGESPSTSVKDNSSSEESVEIMNNVDFIESPVFNQRGRKTGTTKLHKSDVLGQSTTPSHTDKMMLINEPDKGSKYLKQANEKLSSKMLDAGFKVFKLTDDDIQSEAIRLKKVHDDSEKQGLSDIWNNLKSNTTSIGESISRIPHFLAEISFMTSDYIMNDGELLKTYDKLDEQGRDQLLKSIIPSQSGVIELGDNNAKSLNEYQRELSKEIIQYDTNITKDLQNGDYARAGYRTVREVIGSLASMVVASTGAGAVMLGAGEASQSLHELENQGEGLNYKTVSNSVVKGIAEAALERIGGKITATTFKKISGLSKEARTSIAESMMNTYLSSVKEGGGEVLTEVIKDAADALILGKEDAFNNALLRYGDAFIIGKVSGLGMGSIGTMSDVKNVIETSRTNKVIKDVVELTDNNYNNIADVYKSPNLDLPSLKIAVSSKSYDILEAKLKDSDLETETKDEIKKNYLQTRKILKETKIKGLSDQKRLNVAKLVQKKQALEKEMEGLDSSIAAPIKEKIEVVKTNIQEEIARKEITPYQSKDIVVSNDAIKYSKAQNKAFDTREDGGIQADRITEEKAQEIVDDGGKIIMTKDGKAGGYVKSDGYIGGLFKDPSSEHSKAGKVLQDARIKEGGKFTEVLGKNLEDQYIKNGFRPVYRIPFDEKYAPEGWKDNKHLKDKPDNVFMVYDPEGVYKSGDGETISGENAYDSAYNKARDFEVQETSVKDIEKIDLSDSLGINKVIEILDRADASLTKRAKETLGMNLPIPIAQGAIKAMKVAAKTSKLAADVSSAGMNHIISTQWYQGLKKADKDTLHKKGALNIISEMENDIRKSESSKTSNIKKTIREKTGQMDNSKKIKISEKALLKEKFKNLQKGYKTGVKETQQLKNDFLKEVRSYLKPLTNNIPKSTVDRILSITTQVNEKNIDKMEAVLNDLMDKTVRKDLEATINNKKKSLATKIKSKSSTVNESLKDVSKRLKSINHTKVSESDILTLNELYDSVLSAYLPLSNDKYKAVNISETVDAINDIAFNLEQQYYKDLAGTDTELEALGDDLYKQTEEFEKIVNDLGKVRAEKVKQLLIDKATQITGKLQGTVGSSKIEPRFKELLNVNLNNFGVGFIKEYGKILDNYIENGDSIGMIGLLNTVKSQKNKGILSRFKIKKRPVVGESIAGKGREFSASLRDLFGGTVNAAKINVLTNLDNVGKKEVLRAKAFEKFTKGYEDLLYDLSSKNYDLYTTKGNIQRSVISNLIQGDTKEDFEIMKSRIEDQIKKNEVYRSEDKRNKLLKDAYAEFSELDSQQEVLDKVKANDDGTYELIKYVLDAFEEIEPELRRVTSEVHGVRMAEKVPNYIPFMTKKDSKDTSTSTEEELSFHTSNDGMILNPVSNVLSRNKSKKLPKNRELNVDFDRAVSSVMDQMMKDVYLSEDVQLTQKINRRIGENVEIFGKDTADSNKVLRDRITRVVHTYTSKKSSNGKVHKKVLQVEKYLHKTGTRAALGSGTAGIKQSVPVLVGAAVRLGKDAPLLGEAVIEAVRNEIPLLNDYSVGSRADSQGATKLKGTAVDDVQINKLISSGKLTKALVIGGKGIEGIDKVIMFSLTYGDAVVARATWIAYYKKHLKDNNVDISNLDMSKEHELIKSDPIRREAASFAEVSIETTQVSSDKARGSEIFDTNGNFSAKVIRAMLFPFQTFNIASKIRLVDDIGMLRRAVANKDKVARNDALKDLSATIVENAIFSTIKHYMLKPLLAMSAPALAAFFGLKSPKEDDDKEDFIFKQWYSEIFDSLNPLGIGSFLSSVSIEGMNYLAWMHSDSDDNYLKWEHDNKENLPFYYYGNKDGFKVPLLDYGILGIPADIFFNARDDFEYATTPEGYRDTSFGLSKYELDDNQQKFMAAMTLVELMTLVFGTEADWRRSMRKVQRAQFQKEEPMSEKEYRKALQRFN